LGSDDEPAGGASAGAACPDFFGTVHREPANDGHHRREHSRAMSIPTINKTELRRQEGFAEKKSWHSRVHFLEGPGWTKMIGFENDPRARCAIAHMTQSEAAGPETGKPRGRSWRFLWRAMPGIIVAGLVTFICYGLGLSLSVTAFCYLIV